MESKTDENRRADRWHFGKEIPIAVAAGFFVQLFIAIWWAATFTANTRADNRLLIEKVEQLSYQIAAISAERYTKSDAERDKELTFQKISEINRRLENVEGVRKWQR